MKKVSVIIPFYNVEDYIEECIESLEKQTYKNLEIILIDDGSTDRSGKICDSLEKKYNNIIVIHKNNEGVSKSRNEGLKISNGYYVSFIDADDFLEKDFYEKMVEKMELTNSDVSICKYYYYSKNDVQSSKDFNGNEVFDNIKFIDYIENQDSIRGYVWNKLYKKSLLSSISFDKNISLIEDLLFNYEVSQQTTKFCYVSEELYYYRQRDDSALHSNFSMRNITALRAMVKIINILDSVDQRLCNEYKLKFLVEYQKDIYFANVQKNKCLLTSIKEYHKYNKFFNSNIDYGKISSSKLVLKYIYYLIKNKIRRFI